MLPRDLLRLARTVQSTLRRNLASERSCGSPVLGDDDHEALALIDQVVEGLDDIVNRTPIYRKFPDE